MSRVDLINGESAPLLVRRFFAEGDPGPIVAALAQVPELLEPTLPFIGAVLGPSSIDLRTKELVILRTSAVLACRYCVDSHTVVALDGGLSRHEVETLRDAPEGSIVLDDPTDSALMAWTDAVAGGRGPVADALADAMRASFPDHALVELTLLVATTVMLNRFCTALELPTSPDVLRRLVAEGLT